MQTDLQTNSISPIESRDAITSKNFRNFKKCLGFFTVILGDLEDAPPLLSKIQEPNPYSIRVKGKLEIKIRQFEDKIIQFNAGIGRQLTAIQTKTMLRFEKGRALIELCSQKQVGSD